MDAVKVDTQSFLDYADHADDRLALITAYQDAWRLASLKYFGGRAIACMAQIPQTMYYSFLREDLPKPMVRTSDDFFPDDPRQVPPSDGAQRGMLTPKPAPTPGTFSATPTTPFSCSILTSSQTGTCSKPATNTPASTPQHDVFPVVQFISLTRRVSTTST